MLTFTPHHAIIILEGGANMSIGERIKKCREELGLSQEELAKKIGYSSRSTINKIEKGLSDISQSKVIEFAKALNTTPEYLMELTDEKHEKLDGVYFNFAKKAQDDGIDPEDIQMALEMIKKLKKSLIRKMEE